MPSGGSRPALSRYPCHAGSQQTPTGVRDRGPGAKLAAQNGKFIGTVRPRELPNPDPKPACSCGTGGGFSRARGSPSPRDTGARAAPHHAAGLGPTRQAEGWEHPSSPFPRHNPPKKREEKICLIMFEKSNSRIGRNAAQRAPSNSLSHGDPYKGFSPPGTGAEIAATRL